MHTHHDVTHSGVRTPAEPVRPDFMAGMCGGPPGRTRFRCNGLGLGGERAEGGGTNTMHTDLDATCLLGRRFIVERRAGKGE